MRLVEVKNDDALPKGSKVIHKSTFEVGEVLREGISQGIVYVDYPNGGSYPQPKRNIMLIVKD